MKRKFAEKPPMIIVSGSCVNFEEERPKIIEVLIVTTNIHHVNFKLFIAPLLSQNGFNHTRIQTSRNSLLSLRSDSTGHLPGGILSKMTAVRRFIPFGYDTRFFSGRNFDKCDFEILLGTFGSQLSVIRDTVAGAPLDFEYLIVDTDMTVKLSIDPSRFRFCFKSAFFQKESAASLEYADRSYHLEMIRSISLYPESNPII